MTLGGLRSLADRLACSAVVNRKSNDYCEGNPAAAVGSIIPNPNPQFSQVPNPQTTPHWEVFQVTLPLTSLLECYTSNPTPQFSEVPHPQTTPHWEVFQVTLPLTSLLECYASLFPF